MEFQKRKFCLPYLLAGAFLTGLTLVFPQLGFLEWMSMIPIFLGVYRLCDSDKYTLAKSYWFGFLTVYTFYFVNYHWFLYLHPLDSVGIDRFSSLVLVIAGWAGLPLVQALPGGLIFLLFKLMHRTGVFQKNSILRPIAFSCLWVIFEWSSTLHWTGVPWGRLCLGQAQYLPILQSASLFGSYFISFLLLLVNGLLTYAILWWMSRKKALFCGAVAVLLVVINLLTGTVMMNLPSQKDASLLRVAVIQGNINSHEKWTYERQLKTQRVYAELTEQAVEDGAKIVIWPESVFPYSLNKRPALCDYATSLAKQHDVSIVFGALYLDDDGNKYNALYLAEPNGTISEQMYFKRHLVPFGEYIPYKDFINTVIPPLGEFCMTMDNNLSAGEGTNLIETPYGNIGGLICFDSIYEQLAIDSVRDGANVLVVSSNDSWFYNSAAIYQHKAQAQLRAIETGRYLLRSGMTGISAVIDDHGEEIATVTPFEEDYGVADIVLHEDKTLYSATGNIFVYLCIGLCFGVFVLGAIQRKKEML